MAVGKERDEFHLEKLMSDTRGCARVFCVSIFMCNANEDEDVSVPVPLYYRMSECVCSPVLPNQTQLTVACCHNTLPFCNGGCYSL